MRIWTNSLASYAVILTLSLATMATHATDESDEINASKPLAYVRIYCDTDGSSHFADEFMPFSLVDFAPPAPPISVSSVMAAESVAILSSSPEWRGDWHPAPRRLLMFMLSGTLEAEVTDGEIRGFSSGAVILVEDTACKGHISRVVSDERVYMATVPLQIE